MSVRRMVSSLHTLVSFTKLCERLTSISSSPVHSADSAGRTALHWAADRGHLHVVELLINKGAEINAKVRNHFLSLSSTQKNGRKGITI
jgi:ankyrin repeat protein